MNKFTLHDILTFPNLLSFLRIPMAFLFYYFYNWGNGVGVILAAVTLLDGKIARHFDQVSEFGKILDPVADKITQATFILCLFQHYPSTIPLFIFFVIKEVTIGIFALIAVTKSGENHGALIYGKDGAAVYLPGAAAVLGGDADVCGEFDLGYCVSVAAWDDDTVSDRLCADYFVASEAEEIKTT